MMIIMIMIIAIDPLKRMKKIIICTGRSLYLPFLILRFYGFCGGEKDNKAEIKIMKNNWQWIRFVSKYYIDFYEIIISIYEKA